VIFENAIENAKSKAKLGMGLAETPKPKTTVGVVTKLSKSFHWNVMYVDAAKKAPTKGLNKDFGFHINRPFYIVSKLPFNRVVECVGANNVMQKRWRNNAKG
jgi:hypothetical protein